MITTSVAIGVSVILAVATAGLALATAIFHRRDRAVATQRQLVSMQGGALPPAPDSITPYLAAGTLVVVGLLAFVPALTKTHEAKLKIGNCSFTFSVPARIGGTTTVASMETSEQACAATLADSAVYVNGRDAASTKYVAWTDQGTKGAYWSVSLNSGSNEVVLLARDAPRYVSTNVVVDNHEKKTVLKAANCAIGIDAPGNLSKDELYPLDIAFESTECGGLITTEKIVVDGATDKATFLATIASAAGDAELDRYLIKWSGAPQRVDVYVRDSSGGSIVKQYTVSSSQAITVDTIGPLLTSAFGILSTLGGLIAAVVQIFRTVPK